MHYVIGDIHGCYNAWNRLKNRILKNDPDAMFILVGDIVDRGPQVMKMLDWAMKNITDTGKYQMVLGNHEDEKLYWMERLLAIPNLEENFCDILAGADNDNYDFLDVLLDDDVDYQKFCAIYDFMNNLPIYKELDLNVNGVNTHFIISHAGIYESMLDRDCHVIPESLNNRYMYYEHFYPTMRDGRTIMLWNRSQDGYPALNNTVVISGHTPTISSILLDIGATPGKVYRAPNFVNIDCGMVYSLEYPEGITKKGNLAAICLETNEEIYAYKRR